MKDHPQHPKARTRDVVAQPVGDETVVYDSRAHRYHTLSSTVAAVWRLADGTRDAEQIAARVAEECGIGAAADATALALEQLAAAGLLEPGARPALDRREALRRLAAAGVGAALLPAMWSIAAPTPGMAQSPGGTPPTMTCVADHHIFDADSTSLEEALENLLGQALAYARSFAESQGGTYVSHSVEGPRINFFEPLGRWSGVVVVTQVCYRHRPVTPGGP